MIKTIRLQSALAVLVGLALMVTLLLPAITSAQEEEKQRGRSAEVTEKIEERKSAAKEMLAEKRETKETKSTEKRIEACIRRQGKLVSAMARINTQVTKHIGVIDKIYDRVQGFYDKGQLTVANYDELNAAVQQAQIAAVVEVSVLGELNIEIDCENPDVAGTLAAYRDSAKAVKQSLKSYRTALVQLISSLKSEASQQESEEGTESTGETETTQPADTETGTDANGGGN